MLSLPAAGPARAPGIGDRKAGLVHALNFGSRRKSPV